MFIKDKTKVACIISGIGWRVVYFRKLLFETNNEKFSLRRDKSKKINRRPGERSGGGRYLSQRYEEWGWNEKKMTIIWLFVWGFFFFCIYLWHVAWLSWPHSAFESMLNSFFTASYHKVTISLRFAEKKTLFIGLIVGEREYLYNGW